MAVWENRVSLDQDEKVGPGAELRINTHTVSFPLHIPKASVFGTTVAIVQYSTK